MVDEERERGRGRERDNDCVEGIGLKSEAVNNGCVIEMENGGGVEGNSAGLSGVHTYRRRKRGKMSSSLEDKLFEDQKVSTNSACHHTDKTVKEPLDMCFRNSSCNQANLVRMDSHTSTNGSDDSSIKDWRKIVLEQMYQSLNETEGGLQECIRDALVFHPQGGCTSTIKESVHFSKEMQNGTQNASKDHVGDGVMSYGSTDESSVCTNTDLCKRALFDVLISTKFAELCDLLFGNFQGMKINSLFDFSLISSRINEGAYESSPILFHSDNQQVWTKFQKIGTEMLTLANSLSEKTVASFHDKFPMQEFHGLAKVEQTEGSCQYRACTCSRCGEKAEGSDCLVCDFCEEIYHVSCIEPSVQEIPPKSWYCASCRAKGIGSSHENCVLCESINAPRSSITGINRLVTNEEELELEKSSDDLEEDGLRKEEESLPNCKICTDNIGNEKFRLCGHPFCPSKYYHLRCLTVKQLNSYASCWYCPSCLCRVCLTDRDDDKIVLCDGCDQAFHIYCMQPPRASIPKGNWFCAKCDEGIQSIRKARRAYEYTLRKSAENGKGSYENLKNVQKEIGEDLLDKSGGVDMLLTAAKTLNCEENLAALGNKS